MQVKLAEALLRRKELQQKLERIKQIKQNDFFYQIRGERKKVTDGLDEINVDFPKLDLNQVTAEYDFCAKQLRLIDAAIQHTNWTAVIDLDSVVMDDFK